MDFFIATNNAEVMKRMSIQYRTQNRKKKSKRKKESNFCREWTPYKCNVILNSEKKEKGKKTESRFIVVVGKRSKKKN